MNYLLPSIKANIINNTSDIISVKLQSPLKISASFKDIEIIPQDAAIYRGSYQITPKVKEEIVLDTKQKILEEDLKIEKVPSFLVSNNFGGNTFYIGDEI